MPKTIVKSNPVISSADLEEMNQLNQIIDNLDSEGNYSIVISKGTISLYDDDYSEEIASVKIGDSLKPLINAANKLNNKAKIEQYLEGIDIDDLTDEEISVIGELAKKKGY